MTRKKKLVDQTPICDAANLRRIDPRWMPGPVPRRYWEVRLHRRDYLLWSAGRLDFRTMEDFYRLEFKECYRRNQGVGLVGYWGHSALDAVQDCFPEYDWKAWLFLEVANGFWESADNRRSCLLWLGEHLGYRCMADWYELSKDDFLENRCSGLLKYYHGSVSQTVIDLIPERDWYEWKFRRVPPGFWEVAENRHRYLRWLGQELGFHRPEDWYRIQHVDFINHCGAGFIQSSTLFTIMREFLPQLDWDRFDTHLPIAVGDVLRWAEAHLASHGTWPGLESGEIGGTGCNWGSIDRCLKLGQRGLPGGTSLAKFLAKHRGVGRRPPKLSEKQILAWADAHFAATGKWPKQRSGPIPGTRENWTVICSAMTLGSRGFRRGSSLAQLLAQRRGVRNHLGLPPLTKKQILEWAKVHFQATGRWPHTVSGPITQAPGETWSGMEHALREGGRGMPGGSSLSKLLREQRLK